MPARRWRTEPDLRPDGVRAEQQAEGRFAGLRLTGADSAFPAIMTGYDAVATWLTRHGFDLHGPAHQRFLSWCGREGHPDNVLEVGWPVTGD